MHSNKVLIQNFKKLEIFVLAISTSRVTGHRRALGAETMDLKESDAGEFLADTMIGYFRKFNIPNGLKAVGVTKADIPKLVEGKLPQHRVTELSHRPTGPEELAELFRDAMQYW